MKNLVLVAYFFIYVIWGANFLSIHYAIQYIPPFTMIGCRFAVAGLILFLIDFLRNRQIPSWETAKPAILQGLFLNVLGTTTLVWGQQYVPSGLASILVTMVPLWTVLMDRENWQANFRNPWVLIGLILGIGGVLLLTRDGEFRPGGVAIGNYITGLIVIISGSLFWAYGALFVRKKKRTGSLFMNVAIQLLFAGTVQLGIGLMAGEFQQFHPQDMAWKGWLAMTHLILLSSVIGYVCYIWLLQHRSATEVGTHTFVNPVIAVTLGVLLAGEPFTLSMVTALVIVLVAVFLVRYNYLLTKGRKSEMVSKLGK